VAQKLGWTVYDQELLEYIAHEMHQRTSVLETLDEKAYRWAHDWLAALLEGQWQNQDAYIVHLTKVILAVGLQGESVIVGRGASFILPRERSLNVRVIAPDADRIAYLTQLERLTPQDAARHMKETDEQRRQFVRDYFHRDSTDPHEYDLVLDSSQLGEDLCAELVVKALQGKEALRQQRHAAKTRPTPVPQE
jgi:cytidylate kinase